MRSYKIVGTKEHYNILLESGMFFEFYPELTGTWDIDKVKIVNEMKKADSHQPKNHNNELSNYKR